MGVSLTNAIAAGVFALSAMFGAAAADTALAAANTASLQTQEIDVKAFVGQNPSLLVIPGAVPTHQIVVNGGRYTYNYNEAGSPDKTADLAGQTIALTSQNGQNIIVSFGDGGFINSAKSVAPLNAPLASVSPKSIAVNFNMAVEPQPSPTTPPTSEIPNQEASGTLGNQAKSCKFSGSTEPLTNAEGKIIALPKTGQPRCPNWSGMAF